LFAMRPTCAVGAIEMTAEQIDEHDALNMPIA
jgi:hypothetical protein